MKYTTKETLNEVWQDVKTTAFTIGFVGASFSAVIFGLYALEQCSDGETRAESFARVDSLAKVENSYSITINKKTVQFEGIEIELQDFNKDGKVNDVYHRLKFEPLRQTIKHLARDSTDLLGTFEPGIERLMTPAEADSIDNLYQTLMEIGR